jgi:branched-chain amino acid transport system permease protein
VKLALPALLLLALFPWLAGEFLVNLASQILIFAVFAASINLLLGYGGLPTLGHASYLGVAAYTSALLALKLGLSHWAAAPVALLVTTLMASLFGLIALRATGLGFLMLTLALSQVLWGTAYRWVGLTDGDNGLRGLTRPAPFGISLEGATAFYYFALVVTAIAIAFMARFVASPFGAALRGTRDQPRRMGALGHNVWLIRWITFVYAGFWGAVSGLLFVYYHKYIHPISLSLTNSAEGLLAFIAGCSGTLGGPLVGATIVMLLKNYVSAYIERWNMLLGIVFVLIVVFMPEGVVPGAKRLWLRFKSRT